MDAANNPLSWARRSFTASSSTHGFARRGGALRAAASEGLTLVRSDNAAGFMGVCRTASKSNPFEAYLYHNGKKQHLGRYDTEDELQDALTRENTARGTIVEFDNSARMRT